MALFIPVTVECSYSKKKEKEIGHHEHYACG